MAILNVIQGVAAKVGIDPFPTSVFSDASRTSLELRETANEAAAQICQVYDWSALIKTATITGDGVATEFPFATAIPDFGRMIARAELWTGDSWAGGLNHLTNFNDWLQQEGYGFGWTGGSWTVFGKSLHIRSGDDLPFTDGETAKFGYVSANYAVSNTGIPKPQFTADTDAFVLDERLLKLCMIWNWKSAHNQPYAQEFDEYEVTLQRLRIADRTPGVISYGGQHWRWPGSFV